MLTESGVIQMTNDLISRQAAIDATWFEPSYTDPLNVLTEVRDRLKALPSADVAQVRHGRWDVHGEPMPMHDIKGNLSWGNWYVCTGCGFATTAIEGHITQYNYCPNCGADMRGEQNE